MSKYKKLTHVIYKCAYHIIWVPKYRFRILTGEIKTIVERDIKLIYQWKDVGIEEMSIQEDHIHLVCSIPQGYQYQISWAY